VQDTVTEPPQSSRTGPLFLIGSPCSGSATLRRALDRHPHLAIAAETGFLRAVAAHEWIPFWKFGGRWYGRLGLSSEQLYSQLGGFYGRLFTRFAEQQGKRRWGDETPYHAWHILRAARVFPDATFVASVRHPAAVAVSLREHHDYGPKRSARMWTRTNLELVHRARELGSRFLLCRHEDLVADPERTLRELLDALGEPWAPQVLTTAAPESATSWPIPGPGSPLLRRRAASLAGFFGYDLRDPSRLEPLGEKASAGRVVLTGDDLARRAERIDSVDWSVRPRPPSADQLLNPEHYTVVKTESAGPNPADTRWEPAPQGNGGGGSPEVLPRGGPVFLVGAMGSGTTLIRLMLDSHERIAIPSETGFMRAVTANRCIPFWRLGGQWYHRLGWSEEEMDAALRQFYSGLFERFARQHGKQRWGEKTPNHTWHMTEIARLFPDAVFIGMVRHPGGAATSLHNRFHLKFSWPLAVGNWRRLNVAMVERATALGDRFVLCRYEDLVLEPESTMRELLAWLGEPWSAKVLAHHEVHAERQAPVVVEGRTRSTDPIDVARVSRWVQSMDPELEQLLRDKTAALAGFFGYHLDDPTRLDPLVSPGTQRRSIVTGAELARRREQFRDADWGPRPRPGLVDRPLDPRSLTLAQVKTPGASTAPKSSKAPRASKAPGAIETGTDGKAQLGRAGSETVSSDRGAVLSSRAVRAVASRLPESVVPRLRGVAARARASARRRVVSRDP